MYQFTRGRFNVHYLNAPYGLLVEAFGHDGDTLRDGEKVLAQWEGPGWEVYDYRSAVQDPEDVTEWHVQGSVAGIAAMLELLEVVAK